jgi:hypothetical protein
VRQVSHTEIDQDSSRTGGLQGCRRPRPPPPSACTASRTPPGPCRRPPNASTPGASRNATNNTTIHPRVHYIFSDDDDASILPGSAPPDPSHRALVLDLAPATGAPEEDSAGGWRVAWASSLSPSFAVTDSSLSVIQQGHRDDNGSAMLRIDGVEREPVHLMRGGNGSRSGSPSGAAASGTVGKEDVDALVDDFQRRMGVLRRVVGQGHKRREALDEQQGNFEYEDDGVPEQQGVAEYDERRDEEDPVSPTGQVHSQHEEQRWK